jgi:hypothetical protein
MADQRQDGEFGNGFGPHHRQRFWVYPHCSHHRVPLSASPGGSRGPAPSWWRHRPGLGEDRRIRGGVGVADQVEVQLSGIGQHSHAQGDVPLGDPGLEQLQHPRPRQVQRHGWAGEVLTNS